MPVQNAEIADIFSEVADLLDIEGENQFRVRAYRTAARTLSELPQNLSDMVEQDDDLSRLHGIGKDLAGKIKTIVQTGSLPQLEELRAKHGGELSTMMNVAGLGPKRVKQIHESLKVNTLSDLKDAAEQEKIRDLPGMGEKTEKSILEGLARIAGTSDRVKLSIARQFVESLTRKLEDTKGVKTVTVAGSYRRRKETVGDLDVLVTCEKNEPVMEAFTKGRDIQKVVSKGDTRSTILLRKGLQVDLRVVPESGYGSALHYFTGSKAHNIAVRRIAVKKKLKLNEYGLYRGNDQIAGRTEEEVYSALGLPYIPPELRENNGEVEAAAENKLPELIERKHIRGDLHAHSRHTDGRDSIENMAEAAKELGYSYLAVTDHSQKITVTGGVNEKRLMEEVKEIDRINEKLDGIRLLKGCEVDILEDGALDFPDSVLERLDIVIGAVHSKFKLSRKEQTERVLKALSNKYLTFIAHPTGRLIGSRDPYEIDMDRIIRAAADEGCFLELNGNPDRLDLNENYCRSCKENGVKVVLNTDAHSTMDLQFMEFAVGQARRGWLEVDDVVNTKSTKKLMKLLHQRR